MLILPKLRHLILTYIEEQQEDILKPPLTDQEKWALAREKSGLNNSFFRFIHRRYYKRGYRSAFRSSYWSR